MIPSGIASHAPLARFGWKRLGSRVPIEIGLKWLLSSVEPKSPLADGVGMNDETRASGSTRAPPHGWSVRSKTTGFSFVSGLAYRATWRSISLV